MKKNLFCALFSVVLLAFVFSGCSPSSESSEPKILPADQVSAFFDNPKDYVGYEVELSGRVVSEPQGDHKNNVSLSVMCDPNLKTDFVQAICPDSTVVKLFDDVTFKGKVTETIPAADENGEYTLPIIETTEISVTDNGGVWQ